MIQAPRAVLRCTPNLVEGWSTFRLPFQPQGEALVFKRELVAGISGLLPEPGHSLACAYWSNDRSSVDAENVLIYNVGPTCFSQAARQGIRFVRVFSEPPLCPETFSDPGPLHYLAYQVTSPDLELKPWRRGTTVATWTDAEWPPAADASPTLFWLAIRKAQSQLLSRLRDRSALFGLRVTVTGAGSAIMPAKVIKPLFDGAISAFHSHNEPVAMGNAVERLTARGHGDAATLAALLADPDWNLLGARNLLAAYRHGRNTDGVKWNPEDERCVAGELLWTPTTGPKRFSGELFEVLPRRS